MPMANNDEVVSDSYSHFPGRVMDFWPEKTPFSPVWKGFLLTGQGFGGAGKIFSCGEAGFGHSDRPFWTADTAF
jgi:hypothetical protein